MNSNCVIGGPHISGLHIRTKSDQSHLWPYYLRWARCAAICVMRRKSIASPAAPSRNPFFFPPSSCLWEIIIQPRNPQGTPSLKLGLGCQGKNRSSPIFQERHQSPSSKVLRWFCKTWFKNPYCALTVSMISEPHLMCFTSERKWFLALHAAIEFEFLFWADSRRSFHHRQTDGPRTHRSPELCAVSY